VKIAHALKTDKFVKAYPFKRYLPHIRARRVEFPKPGDRLHVLVTKVANEGPTKMNKTLPSKHADDVLATFAPEVRDLALAARTFVLEMIPNIAEMVDVKARIIGYGYSPRYADQVCMLMPTKLGLNLGIAYAMQLPDPKNLLEGTGKLLPGQTQEQIGCANCGFEGSSQSRFRAPGKGRANIKKVIILRNRR
jgi:hypothetical protein